MSINIQLEWIKASKLDLENIKYIIKVEHLTSVVAFHSQQSIEKSFKAIIEKLDKKIPKQHDLIKLKSLFAEKINMDINEDILDSLNLLYIESRYPGDLGLLPYGKPTLEDAKIFYQTAIEIFDKTCDILGIDKRKI